MDLKVESPSYGAEPPSTISAMAIGVAGVAMALVGMAFSVLALLKLRRGYAAVLGPKSLPAKGILLLFLSLALFATEIPIMAAAVWLPSIVFIGLAVELAAAVIALLCYVFAFVLGARDLYNRYKVKPLNTAFILYILFFLLVTVPVAHYLMYKGLDEAARQAGPAQ